LFASARHTLDEVTELKNLMDNNFSSIASGVITANVKQQNTLCNRAAEGIIGYGVAGIVGRYLEEVLPTYTGDFHTQLAMVRETNKSVMGLKITTVCQSAAPWIGGSTSRHSKIPIKPPKASPSFSTI